jgi:hypothetical protein
VRSLDSHSLLSFWETGQRQHPLDRALTVLGAAWPDATHDELAALPLGVRNARLLAVRERLLGPVMRCYATCPTCGERLEFPVDTRALRAMAASPVGEQAVEAAGAVVRFRLPDSRDLAAAAAAGSEAAGREALLRRCVVEASRDGRATAPGALPPEVVAAVEARMEEADPLLELRFDLACPACGGAWSLPLDVAAFVWAELSSQARRLVGEVHALARAYAWSERDILGMSAQRRYLYLSLVGA